MKKYFILGIIIAVMAILISFSLKQETVADSQPTVFYGTAEAGKTVTACLDCDPELCYSTVASSNNTYAIKGHLSSGSYCITDGCGSYIVSYTGTPVLVDFCVSNPPNYCPC